MQMAIRIERLSGQPLALILGVLAMLAPGSASAQQAVVPFQLNFSDPGARSMGFGAAFVALADDATAAFANPAGLVQLLRPEVSVEVRYRDYSLPYTAGGRISGPPSGLGIDTTSGLRTSTSNYDATGLSFLSFVYPKGNWSFAVYRQESADLEFSGETQGLFGDVPCCLSRWYDQRFSSDWDIVAYGLSSAYRISDQFSVGLGLVYTDTSFVSNVTEYLWDEDTSESLLETNSYLPERTYLHELLTASGTDLTPAAGALWKLSEQWSIGGVYRQGFEASMQAILTAGEANDFGVPPGTIILQTPVISVEFPDAYGLGFAYRSIDGRLTLSFQWDRIEYSDIPTSLGLDDQTIDDGNELHLGAEYVFLQSTPVVAVRVGAWLEPDHQMRATSDDPLTRALLPGGEDELHYTAGLGIALQNFQVDLGVDIGDRLNVVSLSAIYSF
jgi:long-subunit fatty acid transport protein